MPEGPDPVALDGRGLGCLRFERGHQPGLLVRIEPFGIARFLGDRPDPDQRPDQPRQRLDDEHHLPAEMRQHDAGDRVGDDGGDRDADQEQRIGPRPLGPGEPFADQHDGAGEHAALEQAEDEAVGDQLVLGAHERGRERHHAPEQQQAEDDPFRAPHRGEPAGRDLQDDVAPEEHAGGEADRRGADAELGAHGGNGHRDVGAVDVGEHVHHEGDAQDAHPAIPVRRELCRCSQDVVPLPPARSFAGG